MGAAAQRQPQSVMGVSEDEVAKLHAELKHQLALQVLLLQALLRSVVTAGLWCVLRVESPISQRVELAVRAA